MSTDLPRTRGALAKNTDAGSTRKAGRMGGMTDLPASLVELARRYGVATEYNDWTGRHTTVADSTLTAVLDAVGVPAATEGERTVALLAHDRDYWARSLPPTIVGRFGVASSFWVHVTHGDPAGLWIRLEDGSVRTGLRQLENNRAPYDLGDRWVGEATFELPGDLPLGYHQLHLQVGSVDTSTLVIISPASLELPARLGPSRAWGLATQLYSVRSQRSWGIGDLTDLTDLAVWSAAQHGAGFVLVNPLHAAAPTAPMEPSPYLPTSRRFVNPLYLRPEAIPEFAYVRPRGILRKVHKEIQARAEGAKRVDRDAAWKAKRSALESVYLAERSAGRELAYAAYRAREGHSVDDFAIWCALAEEYGGDWHHWPEDLQHPSSPAVADFAAEHADTVDFHRWLQWLPKGSARNEGTYVRYDHEAMIGIVALEGHRGGAVVVGEDLGTVEPWVRDYLRGRGLFGTSILWFEADRDGGGGPLPAEKWREYCLSSVTTHDLPPTPGYLAGEHVRLREKLGLLTRPADEELAGDQAQQAAWMAELRRVGLLGDDVSVDEVVLALYRYLGRSPSKLLALSLADAVGDLRTQNQPGTTDEYPNWRGPLSGPDGRKLQLEEGFTDPRAAGLARARNRIVHPPG